MNSTKKYLIIALFATATVAMGQPTYHLVKYNPDQEEVSTFLTAHSTIQNEVDIWSHDIEGTSNKKVSWRVFETPYISNTIFVQQSEVVYEEDIRTEEWMTAPFESTLNEEELYIEKWMTKPFKLAQPIRIEEWML